VTERGWRAVLAALAGGLIAGVGLSLLFIALHSNWTRIPNVTPDAQSTVPYWVPQYLAPTFVSAGWTALILNYRRAPQWALLSAAVLMVQVALVALALVPIAVAGNAGVRVGDLATPLLLVAMFGSPVLAAFLPPGGAGHPSDLGWYLAAGALLPIAMFAGHVLFLNV
jgi:hypothetical protein